MGAAVSQPTQRPQLTVGATWQILHAPGQPRPGDEVPHQPGPRAAVAATQVVPHHALHTHTEVPCEPEHRTDPEPTVYVQRFLSSAGRIVYASGDPPLEEPPRDYGEGWVTLGSQQPYTAAVEYEETPVVTQEMQDRLRESGRLGDDELATNLPGVERSVEVVGGRLPRPRLSPPATCPASPITTSAAFPPGAPRTSDPGGRWLATRRFPNDDGESTAVMGQPPLGPPPSIYGQGWVALEPEGLVSV